MNTYLSFLASPRGAAFQLMDAYQFLPSRENFTEVPKIMYEMYFLAYGMLEERMYLMNTGIGTDGKGGLIVSETEMGEILKAREFLDRMVLKDEKMKNATDIERLNYFKSQFYDMFPSEKAKREKEKIVHASVMPNGK